MASSLSSHYFSLLSLSLLLILFVFVINSQTFLSSHDHGYDCWTIWTFILVSSITGRLEDDSEDSKLGSTEKPSLGLRGAGVEHIGVLEARISGRAASSSLIMPNCLSMGRCKRSDGICQ